MRLPALARKIHKWIALIVAIQAMFWTVTGIYMTAVHIDIIHGDRLVKPDTARPLSLEGLVEPGRLAQFARGLTSARLETQLGQPVYVVEADGGQALFDARTGAKLSPITLEQAQARAVSMFAEDGRVVSTEFITKAPLEVQTRPVPLWRVEFEGAWRPTFYISPFTGELVTRRHDLWRTFDFAWMLHIMDYDDRQDVNNLLLRIFTWMAVVTAASGAWLLLYSFRRRRRARMPVAGAV
ncbi:PepSY domain-containing protein [Phenylobacterium sp.]|uniref:PepSY domain-containing protein n=1 Tax=Phenylobacterium sp. TaxID=1871053 RepID=UPI00398359B2